MLFARTRKTNNHLESFYDEANHLHVNLVVFTYADGSKLGKVTRGTEVLAFGKDAEAFYSTLRNQTHPPA